MSLLGRAPESFSGKAEEIEGWLSQLEDYLLVVGINVTLTDDQKMALLRNCIGLQTCKIIDAFSIKPSTYKEMKTALINHFVPQKNITYERYVFSRCTQQPGENFCSYLNNLQRLAANCDFANSSPDTIENQRIRDQFIVGISDDDVRKRLLSEQKLTLDRLKKVSITMETSSETVSKLHRTEIQDIPVTPQLAQTFRKRNDPASRKCFKCSKPGHIAAECYNVERSKTPVTCSYCQKPYHNAANCFLRKRNERLDDHSKGANNCLLAQISSPTRNLTAKFFDCDIEFLVDTGSTISVVSKDFVRCNSLQPVVAPTEHTVCVADGREIVYNQCLAGPLEIQNVITEATMFVAHNLPVAGILGMDILSGFGSLDLGGNGPSLLMSVLPSVLCEFRDIFDRPLREAKLKSEPVPIISLQDEASPHQAKVRRFAPWEEEVLRKEIPNLLSEGVIRESSSSWRHLPVIVKKSNGGFRVAINYKPVNSVTKRDAFPPPSMEELLAKLDGAKYFSSLDFSQFYHQLPLHPEDCDKTAFFACGKLYEYVRCPFGLTNAVTYCCRVMQSLLGELDGTLVYFDDVLVFGGSQEEHDSRLRKVLEIIRSSGLSLNLQKCSFSKSHVTYLGHLIEDGAISPDPSRSQSLLKHPVPRTPTELDRFLGMCNFFRNYIPHFAELSKALYKMAKTKELAWSPESLKNFNSIKETLSKAILKVPTSSEQLILSADASGDCLGACLSTSKGQPVAFASRKLTDTEQRWSTLDKETMAIVWSIEKFRIFLLGRQFIVKSDHKPISYLFKSDKVPDKVHRWRTRLSDYSFKVEYIQGSENFVADCMSRVFSLAAVDSDSSMSLDVEEIRRAQKHEFRSLYESLKQNRPKSRQLSQSLRSVYRDLRIQDGFICYKDTGRYFIPECLRSKSLLSSHYGHQCAKMTEDRLKQKCFWPGMAKDVERYVDQCRICSLVKPKFKRPPMTPFLVDAPLQLVATDFIGPMPPSYGKRYLLVIIDVFSRFPEVYPVSDMTVSTVISCFKDFFARYGFPDKILSDRGAQFESYEFRQYLERFGIKQTTTTAYHPSSNGSCERFNRTIQEKLLSFMTENGALRNQWLDYLPSALMSYRTGVHSSTGFRPCDLIYSYCVKDFMPRPQASPRKYQEAALNVARNRVNQCNRIRQYDREFPAGSKVVVRAPWKAKLQLPGEEATVVKQCNPQIICVRLRSGKVIHVSAQRCSPVPSGSIGDSSSDSDSFSDPPEIPPRRPVRSHVAPDRLGVVPYDL